jgi:hypothetical protein
MRVPPVDARPPYPQLWGFSTNLVIVAVLVGLTAVDPIKVTEYSIVLSAAALPLTHRDGRLAGKVDDVELTLPHDGGPRS